ncbi:MAG: DUF2809 domain-containing protein [Bryobacteraceae bacterium]|nr:DUF2809 domain-containing protein [Bryobacteraceae bacterium]
MWPLGWIVWDKYLGDALYAAMVYLLLRPWSSRPATQAMLLMTGLEVFQLTLIPARLAGNEHLAVRLVARLLGTQFGWLDLLAYGVGLLAVSWWVRASPQA